MVSVYNTAEELNRFVDVDFRAEFNRRLGADEVAKTMEKDDRLAYMRKLGRYVVLIGDLPAYFDRIRTDLNNVFIGGVSDLSFLCMNVVTLGDIDAMAEIDSFKSANVYKPCIRTPFCMVEGGGLDSAKAGRVFRLNEELEKVPTELRERQLEPGKAMLFAGEKLSIVQML